MLRRLARSIVRALRPPGDPAAGGTTLAPGVLEHAEAEIARIVCARCRSAAVFELGVPDLDPGCLVIWINTATDRERDALSGDAALLEAFRAVLLQAGYPEAAVPRVGFAFESNESVKREYQGNWWYDVPDHPR